MDLHVLVVDDAADIRLLLRALLTRAGCRVTEAAGGAEALAALAQELPDVVMLDVQMPDADGWSVLSQIRADRRTASVPVVLCTVKGQRDDRARGWRLGCDGYVTKPFAIRDVIDQVTAAAQRSDGERRAVRHRSLVGLGDLEGMLR